MHKHIKWLALMLCIYSTSAYSLSTSASSASVIQYAEKLLAAHQPENAYQWLSQHQQQLVGSAKGLYVYGVLALRLGHKQQAFLMLQQVVALDPNNLAAQLDLAIAAIQVGQWAQAEGLLTSLAQRKGNPKGVNRLIASYRNKIKYQLQLLKPLQQATTVIKLGSGYNDNVNLGLLTQQIVLDTLDGAININVDSSSMAMADQYQHISVTHHRTWGNASRTNTPWPDFSITAQGKATSYQVSPQYNTSSAQLSFAKGLTLLSRPAQLSLTTQLLTLGDQVSQDWRLKASTLLASKQTLELQLDQQNKSSIQLSANSPWLGPKGQWFVGLEKHKARASYLGVTVPWTVRNDTHLDAGVNYTSSQDLSAYSPAIFGDKQKTTQTLAINTNLWRFIGQDQKVYVNLAWQNQTSNIALFRTRWTSIEIGITKQLK